MGVNVSLDPSGYRGPRSSYLLGSWTTDAGTVLRARVYLDNYFPRVVNGQRVDPHMTGDTFQRSIKELFVSRMFASGLNVTFGDIRATAHSDNNKRVYDGDGKPMHADITEIDRVLGVALARSHPWGQVEITIADRGRKDLRWDGLMEAVRVSRVSADRRRDVQLTLVNRSGNDAGGIGARHQWQAGMGVTIATDGRVNVFSGEYVRGNFFPGRPASTDAVGVAYERRLMSNGALFVVADYERINGATGVSFYEAGIGAVVARLGRYGHLRIEGGQRRLQPVGTAERAQNGPFVRVGVTFDRGRGALPAPERGLIQ